MDNRTSLSPSESLEIIGQMVDQARFNFKRNAFFFIMWSALLIGAAGFQLLAIHFHLTPYFWLGWPIAGIVGGVLSGIYGRQLERKTDRWTYLDRMYSSIWTIYFLTLVMLLVALVYNKMDPSGYVMVLTGLPTVLTGRLLKFNPLIFGGISLWILGLMALFLLPAYGTVLFIASMVTGYLVPGLLMRNNR